MPARTTFSLSLAVAAVFASSGQAQWDQNGSNIYYEDGRVGIGTSTPAALLHIAEESSNGYAMNVMDRLWVTEDFVGVNRANRITGAEYFGVRAPVNSGYGGMYVSVDHSTALPFYGYRAQGQSAWHYLDYSQWKLQFGGQWSPALTVSSLGRLAIDKNTSIYTLDVGGAMSTDSSIFVKSNGTDVASLGVSSNSSVLTLRGQNRNANVRAGYRSIGDEDRGSLSVGDPNGTSQAGMYVNSSNQGIVWGDVKNFRMEHPRRAGQEIWYASLEGPEAAAYARGTARLEDGEAFVPMPEHFRWVASEVGITVQLTPLSADSLGLAAVEKSREGIRVRELARGTGSYDFDYFVTAVRAGYEDYQPVRDALRLEDAPIEGAEGTLSRD